MIEEEFRLSLPIGTILKDGHTEYEIVATESGKGTLGQGGFGITYLAREKTLKRDVAIKEFFPNAIVARGQTLTVNTRDPDIFKTLRKYFLGEARILASFGDPRIVKVLAFFEANNTAYLVMPYLKGEKLSERIKTARFSENQAENLLFQLIDTLTIIHSADVLHRDLKPDNIIFDTVQTDLPILIDFGSARASDIPGLDQGTQSTFGAYTPSFSPIELNSTGTKKTAATDIYALGATIYRAMFQAGPPDSSVRFEADDECLPQLEAAVKKGKISKKFAMALRKCLELRAKDRFQSLEELKIALGKQPDPVPPPIPKPWLKYVGMGALALVLAGGGVWSWNNKNTASFNTTSQTLVGATSSEIEKAAADQAARQAAAKVAADQAARQAAAKVAADQAAAKLQNPSWISLEAAYSFEDATLLFKKYNAAFSNLQVYEQPKDIFRFVLGPYSRKEAYSRARELRTDKAILQTASVVDWYEAKDLVSDVTIFASLKAVPILPSLPKFSVERQKRVDAFRKALGSVSALENILKVYPGSNEAFLADRLIRRAAQSVSNYSYAPNPLIMACDRAAAMKNNPDNPTGVLGVDVAQARLGILACEMALKEHPNHPRMLVNLAHAMWAAKQDAGAVPLIMRAAEAKYLYGVYLKAKVLQNGWGIDVDEEKAATLFGSICPSLPASCNQLGVAYRDGKGLAEDDGRAVQLFRERCQKNDTVDGCTYLGYSYETAQGVSEHLGEARDHYIESCEKGSGWGCSRLASLYHNGRGVNKDMTEAAIFYEMGCELGSGWGCRAIGKLYKDGEGVTKNDEKAFTFFQRSCDLRFKEGCTSLGYSYETAQGVYKDLRAARRLYAESCEEGSAWGCSRHGYLYERGMGVAVDFSVATSSFEKGCELGNVWGCARLGYLHIQGDASNASDVDAEKYLGKGCDGENAEACAWLGWMHLNDRSASPNKIIAGQLLEKGCKGGNTWACEQLDSLIEITDTVVEPVVEPARIDMSSYNMRELLKAIFTESGLQRSSPIISLPQTPSPSGKRPDIRMAKIWEGNSLAEIKDAIFSTSSRLKRTFSTCDKYSCHDWGRNTPSQVRVREKIIENLLEKTTLTKVLPHYFKIKPLDYFVEIRKANGLFVTIGSVGDVYIFDIDSNLVDTFTIDFSEPFKASKHRRITGAAINSDGNLFLSITRTDSVDGASELGSVYKFAKLTKNAPYNIEWVSPSKSSEGDVALTSTDIIASWGGPDATDYLYRISQKTGRVIERTITPSVANNHYYEAPYLFVQRYGGANVFRLAN